MVQFGDLRYLPAMLLRWAEMKALENLSSPEKDRLFPLIRLRPWFNSKELTNSFDKMADAFGERAYACDLDDWYSGTRTGAASQFRELVQSRSFTRWYSMLRERENIIPCVRLEPEIKSIFNTIDAPWMIERGFGFVLSVYNTSHHGKLKQIVGHIDHNNFFILIDCGWHRDILLEANWAVQQASSIFHIRPRAAVFVGSSSFPDSFEDIGMGDEIDIVEYKFFDQVSRAISQRFNESRVAYSDWATTRPPSSGGGGWIPRIDLPFDRSIKIYRDREYEDETKADACERIAKRVVNVPGWPVPPPTWGHYTIDLTAAGSEFGITSAQMNTATRINMHLHNAIAGVSPAIPVALEEPFEG